MKITPYLSCIFIFITFSLSSKTQSLVSYGSNSIGKDEFLRAYLKNNTEQKTSEKAIRDYLELYIRFKLKVKAAYDLKLDTLANQKAELKDFSRQIAEGFLNDEKSFRNLVEEAFQRSQKDIHLGHIFIANQAGSNDTVRAWKLASAAYNELQKGSDFANVALIYSSDSSVRSNHGDIGYITVFTLPYTLENIAYAIPVGKFSQPYRSNMGYHIFKNLGERKAVGKIKAAQILLAYPTEATSAVKERIKLQADSIFDALQQGASFSTLANKYSNDNPRFAANGEMPEFGIGSYDEAFESAVFSLTKDNAITHPISTSIGYHIVKRIKQIGVNSDIGNDSAMSALKEAVRSDARMEISRNAMLQKIQRAIGFRKMLVPENSLRSYTDSVQNGKKPVTSGISEKTLLFSFTDKKIDVGNWLEYVESQGIVLKNINDDVFKKILEQFEQAVARDYYLDHLEKYDADFAAQVKEFKEGNLLFEVMQRNIWDKASADSTGLRKYFENNKSKYWWEPSVEAVIFNCSDSATARSLKATLEKNKDWRTVITLFEGKVQADSGRFELNQLPVSSKTLPKKGMLTEPLKNTNDNNISFLYVVDEHTGRSARSFEDAKGFVLSDYQAFLEEKWISDLKKKYPVKINEPVLKSLWK